MSIGVIYHKKKLLRIKMNLMLKLLEFYSNRMRSIWLWKNFGQDKLFFFFFQVIDDATNEAFIVDPVEPETVLQAVKDENVNLTTVLTTHHHWDHAGGNKKLLQLNPGKSNYYRRSLVGHRILKGLYTSHFIRKSYFYKSCMTLHWRECFKAKKGER